MHRFAAMLAAALLSSGCHGDRPDTETTEATKMTDSPSTTRDEVRGLAQNAKAGAVLVTESGQPVYIEGLSEWPEETLDREVVATGHLEQTGEEPAPIAEDTGPISARVEGERWILRDPQWAPE